MIRRIPSRIRSVLVALCSVLALAMGMAMFPLIARAEPSTLTITQQPEDVEVEYPLGVSFHVEVSDPDQVASYQWIISDTYSDFVLEGSSASTDTLVIPSTQQDDPDLYARCIITGKDGTVLESEPGMLHVTNPEENKTVLYVGDIAVQPGETLDLAETDFGSGIIAFDADGVNITFENVDFSIEGMTYDRTLSPSLGIFFSRRHRDSQEFIFNLVGENVFYNDYYDPDYNAAGVVFNTFFGSGDDEEPPTVCIQGEGSLTLKGGSNSIYSDADLRIDATVTTEPNGSIYCDAITGQNITAGPNAELSLSCNGTAFRAKRNLVVEEGAEIEVYSSAPHVGVGSTAKSIVNVNGSISITGATIDIEGYADPENFVPYGSMLANFCGFSFYEDMVVSSSDIRIAFSEGKAEETFAMSCYGISGEGDTSSLILTDGTKLTVEIDVPDILFVGGVIVPANLEIGKDCQVKATVVSAGETMGIEADQQLILEGGSIESNVRSTAGSTTFGVVCGALAMEENGSVPRIHSRAENGIALAADTGEHGEFDVEPVDGYEPEKLVIPEGIEILTPASGEINLFGTPGYGETIKAETVYDTADFTKPASEVVIGVPGSDGGEGGGADGTGMVVAGILGVAAIADAVIFFTRKKA